MKTRLLSSATLLVALLLCWACQPSTHSDEAAKLNTAPSQDAKAQLVQGPITPQDTIPLDTASDWTKRWEQVFSSTSLPMVQGFTLPIIDLQQVVSAGADSARFYLGEEPNGEYKLILVGVNSKGEDMINTDPKTPYDRIYDLSNPCPPDCGSLVTK
ncbi:MAG: hypothetical protein AAFW73_09715 [Bacteroidota bacterium]